MLVNWEAPMDRRRALQVVGGSACLLTIPSTIFFVLYAVSTSSNHSPISATSIAAAIFDIFSSLFILFFAIYPLHSSRLYPALGSVPSILGAVLSAVTVGWLNRRVDDLPSTIMGRPVGTMIIAGLALFVVSLVSQIVFWTALIFQVRESIATEDHEMATTHTPPSQQFVDGVTYPSPVFSVSKTSLVSSLRDSKRLSFIFPLSTKTKPRSPVSAHFTWPQSPTSATAVGTERSLVPTEPEVNHFDTWETSDTNIHEHVAASLAVVEQEALEEQARGLSISTTVYTNRSSSEDLPENDEVDYELAEARGNAIERQSSPMLPESEATPRSVSFSVPVTPTAVSPGLQRSDSSPGPMGAHGGTARWLMGSRTP